MDHSSDLAPPASGASANDKLLFWACFMSIVATAFGFIIRTQIIDDWGTQFRLSETQKGEILGVGLWPFAISIVLISLVIDRIGYGTAMVFAFVCHVASAVITICAPMLAGGDSTRGYWILYLGTFIVALGNGTVEAVANPVVATLFPREKTKWLNYLHAGWPGGLVLGGVLALLMGGVRWEYKVALLFLPVVAYGLLMLGRHFPVHERVEAGVSYKEMLQEVGVLGALIVVAMIVRQVGTVFAWSDAVQLLVGTALVAAYGLYVRTLGQPLFIFLLLIMVPLATTELGTDSWITPLMEPEMSKLGLQAGWVLVYTSLIMMVLRFSAGAIVHRLSPLGLLALSALVAAIGLAFLSRSAGLTILAAATIYGFGKTFFWPTMLGVVAEQFPRGGALTLNTMGGVGMLAVGVIGAPLLGNIQDTRIDRELRTRAPELREQVVTPVKTSVFGAYQPVDAEEVKKLSPEEQASIAGIQAGAKKNALMTVAIFPCIMFVCYLVLILYFRSKGGYKAQIIVSEKEEELMMTGGTVGPSEM
jgi:MFS family permease